MRKHFSRGEGIEYESSRWLKREDGAGSAPMSRGVYLARYEVESADPPQDVCSGAYDDPNVFYIGWSTKLRQRLKDYLGGNDLNGLAEALFDLAVNSPEWIRERLQEVEAIQRLPAERRQEARSRNWMRHAIKERFEFQLLILVPTNPEDAERLERELIAHYRGMPVSQLRNRGR